MFIKSCFCGNPESKCAILQMLTCATATGTLEPQADAATRPLTALMSLPENDDAGGSVQSTHWHPSEDGKLLSLHQNALKIWDLNAESTIRNSYLERFPQFVFLLSKHVSKRSQTREYRWWAAPLHHHTTVGMAHPIIDPRFISLELHSSILFFADSHCATVTKYHTNDLVILYIEKKRFRGDCRDRGESNRLSCEPVRYL